ncbi:O-succinylbenzoic acid--CoA ligase [Citrobacter koseri]|uniref:O-succinylbenzoic acid--CoA ligase n=1 Tax=Citrobacter koseri TaxID=545 RepID=A0A2X2VKG7_CITKO|nr:O-succinylbenzoic acid--CoA ligase [Citrobacter koseri]
MSLREMPDSASVSGLQPSSFNDWPWRHWRQVRGDAPALRLNDEVLSWCTLCTRIDALASGFAAQGVSGRLRCDAARLESSANAAGLAGFTAMRARILPVNPQLPQPLLDALLPDLTLPVCFCCWRGENTLPGVATAANAAGGRRTRRRLAADAAEFNDADLWLNRITQGRSAYLPGASGQRGRGGCP